MKYMLMIYNNPQHMAEADMDALMRGHTALFKQLADAGKVVSSASLTPPSPATTRTVYIRQGSSLPAVTDGPFLEAKEYLAGYYLVDCETIDEAIEIARQVPCGAHGAVEVRPIDEDVTRAVRGEQ